MVNQGPVALVTGWASGIGLANDKEGHLRGQVISIPSGVTT